MHLMIEALYEGFSIRKHIWGSSFKKYNFISLADIRVTAMAGTRAQLDEDYIGSSNKTEHYGNAQHGQVKTKSNFYKQ